MAVFYSQRNVLLILLTVFCLLTTTAYLNLGSQTSSNLARNHQLSLELQSPQVCSAPPAQNDPDTIDVDLGKSEYLPETSIIAHAPGWTIFKNLYMSNGTLFIVSSQSPSHFPEIRLMTSTGLPAENNAENVASREPTKQDMSIITPEEGMKRWGAEKRVNARHRVSTIEGTSLLFNDPQQFLNHYYHFVAELFFGTWAFIYGAFNPEAGIWPTSNTHLSQSTPSSASSFNPRIGNDSYQPPDITRAIFIHTDLRGWRDGPGFNAYFLRAVLPSITIEVSEDWKDRISATIPPASIVHKTPDDPVRLTDLKLHGVQSERAWHFPLALLADRSAAHRGVLCGNQNQRTASEAFAFMLQRNGVDRVGRWWLSLTSKLHRYAGASAPLLETATVASSPHELPLPDKVVITYISRQGGRRRLVDKDHAGLVEALEELVSSRNWELNIMKAEQFTKDEQIRTIARTTILVGVHGNGLSHLTMMTPNRVSAVIEIFFPGGFAHDYEWTSEALGMRHFSVWNDTYFTRPHEPEINYPEGFHGTSIPVYGPAVARLIMDHVDQKLT